MLDVSHENQRTNHESPPVGRPAGFFCSSTECLTVFTPSISLPWRCMGTKRSPRLLTSSTGQRERQLPMF